MSLNIKKVDTLPNLHKNTQEPIVLNAFDKEQLVSLFPNQLKNKVKQADTLAEVRYIAYKHDIELDEADIETAFQNATIFEDLHMNEANMELEEEREMQEQEEWESKMTWLKLHSEQHNTEEQVI
ncbi:hypothetical protein ACKXGF_07445 [Alkalibacillus sp. S2W]|uniref:hypothetical protein n=1 Tax=Alkalibacillus sp. S2W TaxID=3386553 RepID=UPI00398D0E51